MENVVLEANLPKKITPMREAVLENIFLYLQKAYDAMDRDRYLGILAA